MTRLLSAAYVALWMLACGPDPHLTADSGPDTSALQDVSEGSDIAEFDVFDAGGLDAELDAAVRDAAPDSVMVEDAGSCVPEVIAPPNLLAECPDCPGARCIPGEMLSGVQRAALRDCSPSHECAPDELLLTGGNFTPVTCEAAFGAEGRCLSACLPGVFEARDSLAQSICPVTHRCVACFDPFDGTNNGACDVGCDVGPTAAPVILPSCCEDRAVCIPSGDVPADSHAFFDACDDEISLCVPRPIAGNVNFLPSACSLASLAGLGPERAGGICAHVCQHGIAPLLPLLAQDDCDEEFMCVPCFDPEDGTPTGACGALLK